jgi:hypothetical protein
LNQEVVDFTPPSSTINAAAYEDILMGFKKAIQQKRPGLFTE